MGQTPETSPTIVNWLKNELTETNMSAFEILSAILDKLTGDKEKIDFFSSSVIGLIASCC